MSSTGRIRRSPWMTSASMPSAVLVISARESSSTWCPTRALPRRRRASAASIRACETLSGSSLIGPGNYTGPLPRCDRSADRGEVHPGAPRRELDRLPRGVGVLGRGRGRLLRPVAPRDPAGREDPGVAGADHGRLDDLGAGLVDVVEGVHRYELLDEVLRRV